MTSHPVAPGWPKWSASFAADTNRPCRKLVLHDGLREELIEHCGHDRRGAWIPREDGIELAGQTVRVAEQHVLWQRPAGDASERLADARVCLAPDGTHVFAELQTESPGLRFEVTRGMDESGESKEHLGGKILAHARRLPGIDEARYGGAKCSGVSLHRCDARRHGMHAGTAMKYSHAAEAALEGYVGKTVGGSRMPERPSSGAHPRTRPLGGPPPDGAVAGSCALCEKKRDSRRAGRDRRAGPLHFRQITRGIAARNASDHPIREIRKPHSD